MSILPNTALPPGGTAPPLVPSPTAVDALHAGVRSMLAGSIPHETLPDGVRAAVCTICDEARRAGLRAEELLPPFKRALGGLAEFQNIRDRWVREELLSRVVTLCIQEFYPRQD